MGEKVGFTNCVFEKLCFGKIVFSAKHSFSKAKTVCWKKTEIFMKNGGLFLNMAKWCFWVFFWGFNVILVCFWCVWRSSRSVKMLVFFQVFWAFVGWLILVYFGFGRFRCFCVSCVCFCFLCCFCFCFVCFVFVFCWIVFGCWFLFCFFFVYFLFFVFLFLCLFLFLFFFGCFFGFLIFVYCFLFFGEGLRVRWGGPKGHLTWP